ncbi:MAG: GH3 auxin-responsive promoter family protein [Verrucomicrobia bacterium]|nr:GH3 auxin-responsive promoter family protein [Verrucomicrobiota bacterium]
MAVSICSWGSTALTQIEESKPFTAWAGDLSGITAIHLPSWVDKFLYEPGAALAQLGDWPQKIKAIAERTHDRDIRLVAGIPSWVLILAAAVRARATNDSRQITDLRAVWPSLECLIHGGVPISPFIDELRTALGAGEFPRSLSRVGGLIATQDADASLGLRLMTDVGLFYEFLPLNEFDESRLAEPGSKVVPSEGVKPGVDYALLLTTPAGLCRYVIGGVWVRFDRRSATCVRWAHEAPAQCLWRTCHRKGTDRRAQHRVPAPWLGIANFHVAPLFADSAAGRSADVTSGGSELKASLKPTAIAMLAHELDAELIRLNDDYEAKRKGRGLEPPELRLVPAGTFERWMRAHGKWGGQSKMPRCRSDREIADELAKLG